MTDKLLQILSDAIDLDEIAAGIISSYESSLDHETEEIEINEDGVRGTLEIRIGFHLEIHGHTWRDPEMLCPSEFIVDSISFSMYDIEINWYDEDTEKTEDITKYITIEEKELYDILKDNLLY